MNLHEEKEMKVCFATSECVPFVKTGGLADVSGSLPRALVGAGCDVKVFLPRYSAIAPEQHGLVRAENLKNIAVQLGEKSANCDIFYKKDPDTGVEFYFVEQAEYFHRPHIYTNDPDEDERFLVFQEAILQAMQRLGWTPDILHANDWQTALLPVYLKLKSPWNQVFSATRSVFSIHNIAYQGKFPLPTIQKAGLPAGHAYPTGPFEFYSAFSFLKAGIVFADKITTVSETYAREIQTPAFGAGLDGVLRSRQADLIGILNGIDSEMWNPSVDGIIPYKYSARSLHFKTRNKKALLARANLEYQPGVPLIGLIARLVEQKGIDLLPPIMEELLQLSVQWVVLGSGEWQYEELFRATAAAHPEKMYAYIGFDNELAHLITAGADMFLMPSRYEPCGLNQMYSLNYGTIPIVRKTGGLADTVKDYQENAKAGNGITFEAYAPEALLQAVRRACSLYHDREVWREMMLRGMSTDFSWSASARKYLQLYRALQKNSSQPAEAVSS